MISATAPPALLECLDAIHRLGRDRAPVSIRRVARRLATGREEAARNILALQGLGLVASDIAGRVRLTSDGERLGMALLRKHRLLERFLADTLKLPWARVHEEACGLTAVLSDDVAEGLAAFLGHPADCPHGNPIPSAAGELPGDGAVPLHRLARGRAGVIARIEREEPELLRYLSVLGLFPGTTVEVEEVGPFGGPVLVRIGSSRYALGRDVASRILVREG